MEEKIIVEAQIHVGGATIITLASLRRWRGRYSLLVTKNPVAIVAVSKGEACAFRPTGEEVPIERLIEEAPAVRAVLETLKRNRTQ